MSFPKLKKSTAPVAELEGGAYAATIRSISFAGNHNLGGRGLTPCCAIEFVVQNGFDETSVHRLYPWSIGVFNDPTTGERTPSALRRVIEGVIPSKVEEFDEGAAEEFPIEILLGKPVTLTIEVKAGSNGGSFSNVVNVTSAPEEQAISLTDEPFMFNGEDRAAFRRLPDAIKAACRRGGISL